MKHCLAKTRDKHTALRSLTQQSTVIWPVLHHFHPLNPLQMAKFLSANRHFCNYSFFPKDKNRFPSKVPAKQPIPLWIISSNSKRPRQKISWHPNHPGKNQAKHQAVIPFYLFMISNRQQKPSRRQQHHIQQIFQQKTLIRHRSRPANRLYDFFPWPE